MGQRIGPMQKWTNRFSIRGSAMAFFYDFVASFFKSKSKSVEEMIRDGCLMAVRMLQNDGVRTELKLTPAQTEKIMALVNESRQKHRPGKVEGKERMERIAAVAGDVLEGIGKAQLLNAAQQKRLTQIVWQNRGAAAFGDPVLQQALELSEEQKQAIKGIVESNQGAPGEGKQTAELRRTRQASALALLTPEQKSRWEELKGAPFEVQLQQGGQGGRGGRGGEAMDFPSQDF